MSDTAIIDRDGRLDSFIGWLAASPNIGWTSKADGKIGYATFSINGWIIRLSIGGALVQAINYSAYCKYLKAGTKKTTRT